MAYSSTNPPVCLTPGSFGGQATRLWGYRSSAETVAQICATSYFTDGYSRGMRIRDFILVSPATSSTSFAIGMVVAQTTGAGVTITVAATSS